MKSMPSSRRGFIATTASALAAGGLWENLVRPANASNRTRGIPLSVAGYPYDRVAALAEGRVQVADCEVKFETSKIGELNTHAFQGPAERDVSELGLLPYLLAFANDDFRKYELLPIFVLKVFRHKSIFVRSDSGIDEPADLRGKRVATPGYSSSGLTWIRGILKDEYELSPEDINWVVTTRDSAVNQTGGASAWEKQIPDGLKYESAPEGKDESQLLLDGVVDAIFHPAEPRAFVERDPRIRRLFSDPRQVEQAYFKRTGIFPIMHVVGMRRDLAEREPWLRKAIFDAYVEAKRMNFEHMQRIQWAYDSLPWYGQELNETRQAMGEHFYSYGLPSNKDSFNAALRYAHDQGLTDRKLEIKDLFHSSVIDLKDA